MSRSEAPFSIWKFSLSVAVQYTLLLVGFSFLAPTMWSRQLSAGIGAFLIVFVYVQLFNCFFEWGFHRYILHGRIHPWLTRFSRGHRNHHALTPIQIRENEAGPGRVILNRYPIIEAEQHEDAAFPPYALAVFWLLFSPIWITVQILLPDAPILLGASASIAWSMISYEVFHSIEHYPFEWWEKATSHPRWGFLWKKVYGFHHFHHANISANEAISGFFGLPMADWVFRTYHQPQDLLLHGRVASAKEFAVHPPWPFVVWFDSWARRREARILHAKKNKTANRPFPPERKES